MSFSTWWDENWEEVCRYLLIQDKARIIWQASRENQQEYQKYEFCRATDCVELKNNMKFCELNKTCSSSAKEFHHWLKENGYRIVKD
jgi:hypothetical protein